MFGHLVFLWLKYRPVNTLTKCGKRRLNNWDKWSKKILLGCQLTNSHQNTRTLLTDRKFWIFFKTLFPDWDHDFFCSGYGKKWRNEQRIRNYFDIRSWRTMKMWTRIFPDLSLRSWTIPPKKTKRSLVDQRTKKRRSCCILSAHKIKTKYSWDLFSHSCSWLLFALMMNIEFLF